MRILFVVYSMSGGAGKQICLTANAMTAKGHDVMIYAYHWNDSPIFQLLPKVRYIPEQNIKKNSFWDYFFTIKRIRNHVKKFNPDIVIGWRTNAGAVVALSCIGLSVKTVFAERSDPYKEHSIKLAVAKFFCRFCDSAAFQTNGAREYYKCFKNNCLVVANPFSSNDNNIVPLPINCRNKEIIFAGRFNISQKRQDIALKAFAEFHKTHSEYKLVFFGDGLGLNYIKKMSEKFGLKDSVVFEGLVKNVKERMQKGRAFLLTSDYEGIPNVIIEAFSVGLPVVTTDCSPGGARLLVQDGINGFISPCGDYLQISSKLSELVDDDDLANKFMVNGKAKVHNFDPNVIFSKWNDFFYKLVN